MADRFLCIIAETVDQMTEASDSSEPAACERLLAKLVERFEADSAFLRHTDNRLRASTLIAEWPPRDPVDGPDSLATIYFGDDDIMLSEGLKGPMVISPDSSKFVLSSGFPVCRDRALAVAVAPLVRGTVTTGVIGLTKTGGKRWAPRELDALGVVAALFAQLQARTAEESRWRRLAEQDELTGLQNRRALTAEVRRRLGVGRPGPVAALYVDVDRLKTINDQLGHAAGDVVIRTCAQRLGAKAGKDALIARVGGDEFVVVPDASMSLDGAEDLAHKIRTTTYEPVRIGDELVTSTVSIGVAVGIPGVDDCDDLLLRADHAALAVKRKGGNGIVVFDRDTAWQGAGQPDSEPQLPVGIDSDALLLQYQPEIDLRTGEVLAAEALACWQQSARGLLTADAVKGAADSASLAGTLGRWVMRRACGDFSRWRSHGVGQHATLRLNVVPAHFASCGFAESVADTIDEFGIDPGSVCLEIRERAMVSDIQHTQATLAMLKDIGVQIAIDDFGTGDVVLSHLRSLPVDMLKINTGFIRDLGSNAADLAIVRAIIGLAEAVGLQLTAEGVETPIAAATLLRHGCNRAQGYLLSRPVTADAMESLLSRRRMALPFDATDASLAPVLSASG